MQVVFRLKAPQPIEPQGFIFRYLYYNTTTKMKNSPKLAILQSLDAMDTPQMENVLNYIKGLMTQTPRSNDSFKREAMKEIRQALRKSKKGLQLAA